MKIKGKVRCFYNGNELLEVGQEAEVSAAVAKMLVGFGYAEALEDFEEDNTEEKEALIAKAKELGVQGVLQNFKIETLKKKIAEAELGAGASGTD